MGVAIHYRGRLTNSESFRNLVEIARTEAARRGWQVTDAAFGLRGVILQPHPRCDPLRFEFEADFSIEEFVKTQFAPTDVHLAVIDVLRSVTEYFSEFEVEDEGEYWETRDMKVLEGHRAAFETALKTYLAENPRATGPTRVSDGRWVDVMEH